MKKSQLEFKIIELLRIKYYISNRNVPEDKGEILFEKCTASIRIPSASYGQ